MNLLNNLIGKPNLKSLDISDNHLKLEFFKENDINKNNINTQECIEYIEPESSVDITKKKYLSTKEIEERSDFIKSNLQDIGSSELSIPRGASDASGSEPGEKFISTQKETFFCDICGKPLSDDNMINIKKGNIICSNCIV